MKRKLQNRIKVYKLKLQEYQLLKMNIKHDPSLLMECNRRIKWILKRLFNAIDSYELITQDTRYNNLRLIISTQIQKLHNY